MPNKKIVNLSKESTSMPTIDLNNRKNSFDEVEIGYTKDMAQKEALRCLNCKHKPCVSGCPVEIDIPAFISHIRNSRIDEANSILSKYTSLPAICGRVCSQEKQCQLKCIRGKNGDPVAIGSLERYVADNAGTLTLNAAENKNCKIAIIGSGPSGITCAKFLALKGYKVKIFEALHYPGGFMAYGIPKFRLPQTILDKEVKTLIDLGVDIQTNTEFGKVFSLNTLFSEKNFKAVYISIGAWIPKLLNIPGENFSGVYSANEFLSKINLTNKYACKDSTCFISPHHTVVIGGGNVAIDAARCAVRLGSDVTIVYRRTENDMSVSKKELEYAKEEGVKFRFSGTPLEICGINQKLSGVKFIKTEYINSSYDITKKNLISENKTFFIEADCVVVAIGSSISSIIRENCENISVDSSGKIIVDESTLQTSMPGVYAGGDVVTGSSTVVSAIAAGKRAAESIHNYLVKTGDAFI